MEKLTIRFERREQLICLNQTSEKLIKERTGHKTLDALRLYERTSTKQQKSLTCSSSSKENKLLFSSPGGSTSNLASPPHRLC